MVRYAHNKKNMMAAKTEKRRYGPIPKDAAERLAKRVTVFFTQNDYDRLVLKVGGSASAVPAYLRALAVAGAPAPLPPVIPQTNAEVWISTAGLQNNLNQLVRRLNADGLVEAEVKELLLIVQSLRMALVGVKQ